MLNVTLSLLPNSSGTLEGCYMGHPRLQSLSEGSSSLLDMIVYLWSVTGGFEKHFNIEKNYIFLTDIYWWWTVLVCLKLWHGYDETNVNPKLYMYFNFHIHLYFVLSDIKSFQLSWIVLNSKSPVWHMLYCNRYI